ncbi:glycosyltransferase family 4 protein [Robertkochia sediminum]|uniref:glycosyltransferase family 4 protein n=1 Tax=Robertkochia sediminum TaxID=2785326 RepID=UPI0019330C9C|nr:glycosyltransferase family 4 protein [Robertkochia sediminum]MBL7474046.1 glycosyltransferase family 4 protein [Robertkochia sediminum]
MKIHCLHLCNDFSGSMVHSNLYRSLACEIDQTVFFPIRREQQVKKAKDLASSSSLELVCSRKLSPLHRVFFRRKVSYLLKDLTPLLHQEQFDLVHATTLFSDGALAFKIFKAYKIPYIITVRATDMNLFLKYRKDLYGLAREIIKNAQQLVFISEALKSSFIRHLPKLKLGQEVQDKGIVVPNGIDPFWLDNIVLKKTLDPERFNLVYIGKFNENKNVLSLIKAVSDLRDKIPNLRLDLIGGGGSEEKEVLKLVQQLDYLSYQGAIYEKDHLKDRLRSADVFIMVSKSETFGLVYIEALTQGLPVIYTKNEGVDGMFDFDIGAHANAFSVASIAQAIHQVNKNYNDLDLTKINFKRFDWKEIRKVYLEIYQKAVGSHTSVSKQ